MMLMYTICVGFRLAFSDYGIIAARIASLFGIVEVVLIPMLILIFRPKLLVFFGIVVYASMMLVINLFIRDGRQPYIMSVL